jgi:hypothetical protein
MVASAHAGEDIRVPGELPGKNLVRWTLEYQIVVTATQVCHGRILDFFGKHVCAR